MLGFDERHVIKSILRLGFRNVDSIHLIVPAGIVDKRTREAIKRIESLADAAGVARVVVHEINHTDFDEAALRVASILSAASEGGSETILSLGGGLRALVLEAYAAALSLPDEVRRHVKVVVDLETGEGYVEPSTAPPKYRPLSDTELRILSKASEAGAVRPTEASKALRIPKSTAWKLLNNLVKEGLLEKKDRGSYSLTNWGQKLLKHYQPQHPTQSKT